MTHTAPELLVLENAVLTPKAVVYALGILFYYMVCGRLPFTGAPLEVLTHHFESPLPPPPAQAERKKAAPRAMGRPTWTRDGRMIDCRCG